MLPIMCEVILFSQAAKLVTMETKLINSEVLWLLVTSQTSNLHTHDCVLPSECGSLAGEF